MSKWDVGGGREEEGGREGERKREGGRERGSSFSLSLWLSRIQLALSEEYHQLYLVGTPVINKIITNHWIKIYSYIYSSKHHYYMYMYVPCFPMSSIRNCWINTHTVEPFITFVHLSNEDTSLIRTHQSQVNKDHTLKRGHLSNKDTFLNLVPVVSNVWEVLLHSYQYICLH